MSMGLKNITFREVSLVNYLVEYWSDQSGQYHSLCCMSRGEGESAWIIPVDIFAFVLLK